jgi:membrane-bound serine protease (ClpP class)
VLAYTWSESNWSFTMLTAALPLAVLLQQTTDVHPLLAVLADPNVAYILLSLGFLGLFLELAAPGTSVPGVLGAICLTLAAVALWQLPFEWRGVLMILVAFILLLIDLFVPSLGLLTIGGLVLMVAGSYVLFDESQGVAISRPLIWVVAILLGLMFAAIGGFALAVLRRKPVTGREGMLGMVGTVRQTLDPDGMIYIDGALWQATATPDDPDTTPTIHERVPVTVTGIDGLRLFVRRATAEEAERAGVVVMGDRRPVMPDTDTPRIQTT